MTIITHRVLLHVFIGVPPAFIFGISCEIRAFEIVHFLQQMCQWQAVTPVTFSLAPHNAQGMCHCSALPSPLMNTWLTSDSSKGQQPLSSSKAYKDSQLQLSPEQPQPPQRPPRAVIPKMSSHEAQSIVQNMSRELMMSHARASSSVAATLQVMKCDVV